MSSESETKVLLYFGIAFVIVAILGFVVYLTYPHAMTLGLVGAVFLVLGIACLGAWAWIRWGEKIGEDKPGVMQQFVSARYSTLREYLGHG